MGVPEASANLDDVLMLGKHNVRCARQLTNVLPVAIAACKECLAQADLCLRVYGAYPRHNGRAFALREDVQRHDLLNEPEKTVRSNRQLVIREQLIHFIFCEIADRRCVARVAQ
jgi:hypothetical protein